MTFSLKGSLKKYGKLFQQQSALYDQRTAHTDTVRSCTTNVSPPLTTTTMADTSSRWINTSRLAVSGLGAANAAWPLIYRPWSGSRTAQTHAQKQTNGETTAFVSRACGVIMCYITTSAWRAPSDFNGRDVNKCLTGTLAATRRLKKGGVVKRQVRGSRCINQAGL